MDRDGDGRAYFKGEPSFDEHVARTEIEKEVRQEYDKALQARAGDERDRRVLALVISAVIALAVALPSLSFVLGLSWRILMWASGQGW